MHCSTLQHTAVHCNARRVWQHTHGTRQCSRHCNALQHTAVHCSTLCNTLQHTAAHCSTLQHTATHCNTLQHTAAHCNTLQYTAVHCSTLQQTATHCSTLQHTAVHCSTLQYTATHCSTRHDNIHIARRRDSQQSARLLFVYTSHSPMQQTPQHTAAHCNTLQLTATHCNTRPIWKQTNCSTQKFSEVRTIIRFCSTLSSKLTFENVYLDLQRPNFLQCSFDRIQGSFAQIQGSFDRR